MRLNNTVKGGNETHKYGEFKSEKIKLYLMMAEKRKRDETARQPRHGQICRDGIVKKKQLKLHLNIYEYARFTISYWNSK